MHRTRIVAVGMALLFTLPAGAFPVTDKSPNIEGTWVPEPGLDFTFSHRFTVASGKVSNFPTFTLGSGLWSGGALGLKYATNSALVSGAFNELEFWLKQRLLSEAAGAPLSLSVLADYNLTATSLDGEMIAERMLGPIRLAATVRGFSNVAGRGLPGIAAGGNLGWRITDFLWLTGDVVKVLNTDDMPAWGAGVHAVIPFSPHTLGLQVTNANTTTRQGSSVGTSTIFCGFEFSIPFTSVARWVAIVMPPKKPTPESPAAKPQSTASTPPAATTPPAAVANAAPAAVPARAPAVITAKDMAFTPATVTVPVGATVTWVNGESEMMHSVTSNTGLFDTYVAPGEKTTYTFTKAGTYEFHCTPHPTMTGTITVQ